MSLIPDYANTVGSAMSYNRKAADTKEKEKTDGSDSFPSVFIVFSTLVKICNISILFWNRSGEIEKEIDWQTVLQ